MAEPNQLPNSIYLLPLDINTTEISDRISICLAKAESLAHVAASIDFEAFTPESLDPFLYTLIEIIQEARWLYSKNRPTL